MVGGDWSARSIFLSPQGHPHSLMESSREAEKAHRATSDPAPPPGTADSRYQERRIKQVDRGPGFRVTGSAGLFRELARQPGPNAPRNQMSTDEGIRPGP